MPDELVEFKDPFAADAFVEKHVCSACWGMLIKIRPDPQVRVWTVQCSDCKDKTRGFVTRRWAQQRAELSRAELIEAKHALREAVPWLNSKKTEDQILKELGFS